MDEDVPILLYCVLVCLVSFGPPQSASYSEHVLERSVRSFPTRPSLEHVLLRNARSLSRRVPTSASSSGTSDLFSGASVLGIRTSPRQGVRGGTRPSHPRTPATRVWGVTGPPLATQGVCRPGGGGGVVQARGVQLDWRYALVHGGLIS